MARRRGKAVDNRAEMMAKGYINCNSCDKLSKPGSIRCQECRRLLPKGKRILALVLSAAIVASSAGAVILFQEPKATPLTSVLEYSPSSTSAPLGDSIKVVFTREMNRTSVERSFSISPHTNGTFEWQGITMTFDPDEPLTNSTAYYVSIGNQARDAWERPLDSSIFKWSFITEGASSGRRSVGAGDNAFWIERYPMELSWPINVEHPQWVLDALGDGVVMILDHSQTCSPCVEQTAICNEITANDPGGLEFFDFISGESEPRASEVFMTYDPDGGMNYIPLTVIITKVHDQNGGYSIAWHSWEGVVPDAVLRSWLSDAQSYNNESSTGEPL